jgi:hypothetical protein
VADTPKLHAYAVTLNFGEGGPLTTAVLLTPDAASASALAMLNMLRQAPKPITEDLLSVLAVELQPEFLRHLLRAVEGRLPASGTADVLSLVPDGAQLPESIHPGPQTGETGLKNPWPGLDPYKSAESQGFGRRLWFEPQEPEPPGAA